MKNETNFARSAARAVTIFPVALVNAEKFAQAARGRGGYLPHHVYQEYVEQNREVASRGDVLAYTEYDGTVTLEAPCGWRYSDAAPGTFRYLQTPW